ncbi:DUF1572 family protein [Chryseobacterium balustinum]|uniref:Protein of uncharacterized function (DUF1572) n=1 Tax=Chryseobacterium balustinum TaxID=246 RepID=A0AAX2IJ33_9FLAO|nr:DUF1572 family protein [Chryseobacterium balustinum]AZB30596.1 DUF1572 domain-containing protein [Chryseobacterium balustinum]SKB50336.1 Protein of unknown function [Chryseobacterium balustinum]SQA88985.1 Protein of uncharacterised function (DUF1572) [Chryseobacterium balustinum]
MKDLFIKRFEYYKMLGDKSFEQLLDEQFFWQFNEESNSIAVIVKHVAGNMLSRWTNFLTEDGEKSWRNRDKEFVNTFKTKDEVLQYWEKGWKCLFDALNQINDVNLYSTIYIRNEAHSVIDAVFRQLAHYPYHIGQIVFIAKMMKNEDWKTLSIARNKSSDFNNEMKNKFTKEETDLNSSPVCFENTPDVRDDYKL